MSLNRPPPRRSLALLLGTLVLFPSFAAAVCGPFTDVVNLTYCPFIKEIYNLGITLGTSPTTYDPTSNVPREQMAAFLARNFDRTAARTSRRGAMNQWWTTTPHFDQGLGITLIYDLPRLMASDGADTWVATDNQIDRVRASTGESLSSYVDNSGHAFGVLVAMDRVFATVRGSPGSLVMATPSSAYIPNATSVATLGDNPGGIAFDGNKIWTANAASLSIVTPASGVGWAVTSITTGITEPAGLVFDGHNMWGTQNEAGVHESGLLLKFDSVGAILQSVGVGDGASHPVFDGNNIWVPNFFDNSLTVVRVSDGVVVKTFSSSNGNQNGLSHPNQAAFDGQNVLVTNVTGSLSLFKAADLTAIASFPTTGFIPFGVCSDGVNFWVTFVGVDGFGYIGRF